jgi:hypothetical protein
LNRSLPSIFSFGYFPPLLESHQAPDASRVPAAPPPIASPPAARDSLLLYSSSASPSFLAQCRRVACRDEAGAATGTTTSSVAFTVSGHPVVRRHRTTVAAVFFVFQTSFYTSVTTPLRGAERSTTNLACWSKPPQARYGWASFPSSRRSSAA